MASEFDLDLALRRLKPEKQAARLRRRKDAELSSIEQAAPAGPPLLLDTCVYLHVLRGKTPQKVDELLHTRTLFHSAVVIGELTYRLGARVPANDKERAARERLATAIRMIPPHRVMAPTSPVWGEAGVLAGLRARVGGFGEGQQQAGLNDALLYLQGLAAGSVILTADTDYDILQQLVPAGRILLYQATE